MSNNLNIGVDLSAKKDEAIKFDQDKPSYSMVPQLAINEVAKVFTYGAKKYGTFNYSGKMEVLRYIDASQRHTNQFLTGEDLDESGIHHLACVAANALMALDSILTKQSIDNRNPIYKNGKTL